jgi:hypothetical protein
VTAFFLLHFQAGLFVYDIFWVFFTPVMVSVAKSFDAPIKVSTLSDLFANMIIRLFHLFAANSTNLTLHCYAQLLFPTADAARPFSMLGLGDIVIPGQYESFFVACYVHMLYYRMFGLVIGAALSNLLFISFFIL